LEIHAWFLAVSGNLYFSIENHPGKLQQTVQYKEPGDQLFSSHNVYLSYGNFQAESKFNYMYT
jgi:hypothetical protein